MRVRVQPWAPHALVTLQYGELAPPRVAAGSVRGAELLTSDAVARASSALRFRLAATAADASSAFEFETRDDARLSPASLRCEEQLVADSAPSASAYRTCVAIRAAATNTLSLDGHDVKTWSEPMKSGFVMDWSPPGPVAASALRMTTSKDPSWVSYGYITVFACT